MIRLANASEIPLLLDLTQACDKHMRAKGIVQWNAEYPNETVFGNDIERDELYVLVEQREILGCVVSTSVKDSEYDEVTWLTPDGNNRYIHRLAVHPAHQGKGLAQKLMAEMEKQARNAGVTSIRLDTFSQNKRNQRFYEQRGYHRLGDIYLPNQSEFPFHCYELVLD